MKASGKKWIVIIICEILVLIGIYCVMRFGFSMDLLDRSGWNTRKGTVRYLDYYGRPQLQWQTIEDKIYYFAPENGSMLTGWANIDGDTYYFGDDGMMYTGWLEQDGRIYYLAQDGKMAKALRLIGEKQYLFGEDGSMLTGWQTVDGIRYYFGQDGAALTGWQTLDKQRYYFSDTGAPLVGWQEIENDRYHFAQDGAMTIGWYQEKNSKYYLNADGKLHTGWLQLEQDKYYFADDGKMYTGWLTWEEDRYYLQKDGTMAIGEVVIDDVSNFFTSTGKYVLLTNPWHAIPENYALDLVELDGFLVDRSCRDALEQMIEDCAAAGYDCEINNTYRSKEDQQEIWDSRMAQYMAEGFSYEDAYANVALSVAFVGHSEHHTGLAVDLNGSDEMFDWLDKNCWDYGFIVRYLDGTTDWTGIIYEPWHFRYVGTELSKELEELGLCMEAYMNMLTEKNKE